MKMQFRHEWAQRDEVLIQLEVPEWVYLACSQYAALT